MCVHNATVFCNVTDRPIGHLLVEVIEGRCCVLWCDQECMWMLIEEIVILVLVDDRNQLTI